MHRSGVHDERRRIRVWNVERQRPGYEYEDEDGGADASPSPFDAAAPDADGG